LASLAYELAATPVSDDDLARELGIETARVASLSRGRLRRFAADGIGPADLAAKAAQAALAHTGLTPADVDFVIFSTNTPDYTFPGSACLLQAALGCDQVGCLDVRAGCSGFIVALDLARRYVASGTYARVLVAAGEVPSHQNRFDGVAPELACLTADAAAVAILSAQDAAPAVLAARARTDGRLHRLLWCEFPASRNLGSAGVQRGERLTRSAIETGKIYPVADFAGLREAAVRELPRLVEEALAEARVDRVDAAIVAHVDPGTADAVATALSPRTGRVVPSDTVYAYSASLPLALARALERGDLRKGETVALVTAGSGASWAVAVVQL
jgi:3-oxoacyl-[acyl-carrier-protein] synthase-3